MSSYTKYERNKHLIGQIINGWTILDITAYDNKHYTYALAQCLCGNIKEMPLTKITNNRIKDCGCGHQNRLNDAIKRKYEYLIDTQINGWTILDILPSNNEIPFTMALCKCQCGTTKKVRLSYVLNGYSKNCGCGRKEMLRETRTKNLVGQRFGKLLVTELLENSDKFKRRMYKCRCDCGNEIITSSICLTEHHTFSCGCLTSYWNMFIKQFLTSKGIKYEAEYPVIINNVRFRFDFYLPDYNLFIEYDGELHYIANQHFGGEEGLTKRKLYDNIKNKYCEDNNINLLRIPYWEKNDIETIINNHLQRLNEKGFTKSA